MAIVRRLLELSRARVYFARPTITIAKIRDYSQSILETASNVEELHRWLHTQYAANALGCRVSGNKIRFTLCDWGYYLLRKYSPIYPLSEITR